MSESNLIPIEFSYPVTENSILSFFEFIYHRHEVFIRKEVKEQDFPWTDDQILSNYKFCNAYRELDRSTRYLIHTIILNEDLSLEEKVINTIAFRFFNKYEFFEDILGEFLSADSEVWKEKFSEYEEILDKAKEKGSIFSDAYLITQVPFQKENHYRKSDKHVQVLLLLREIVSDLPNFMKEVFTSPTSPKDSWKRIRAYRMIGSFIAYEIWTDFTYFPEFKYSDNDFVVAGPGAEWGIRLIWDNEELTRKQTNGLLEELYQSQEYFWKRLKETQGKNWKTKYYDRSYHRSSELSRRNLEHSLCEYRKYVNLSQGKGKRRIYRPEV